jgi:hypothetical protein
LVCQTKLGAQLECKVGEKPPIKAMNPIHRINPGESAILAGASNQTDPSVSSGQSWPAFPTRASDVDTIRTVNTIK